METLLACGLPGAGGLPRMLWAFVRLLQPAKGAGFRVAAADAGLGDVAGEAVAKT